MPNIERQVACYALVELPDGACAAFAAAGFASPSSAHTPLAPTSGATTRNWHEHAGANARLALSLAGETIVEPVLQLTSADVAARVEARAAQSLASMVGIRNVAATSDAQARGEQ